MLTDKRVMGVETQLRIGKRAVIRNVWWTPRVFTKKYEGKFKGEGLQAMADIGNWQTGIAGLSPARHGWGHTPEYAIRCAIERNEEQIKILQQACVELGVALQNCLKGDDREDV